ncbi:hypothetical protein LC593_08830 [Nostoc sp. CHAB 5844]|nr:hypothetical protein [Nostoc sp. CHAB 5844]
MIAKSILATPDIIMGLPEKNYSISNNDNHFKQGGIKQFLQVFALKQMLAFLSQALQRKYQVVEGIYLPSG